MSTDTMTAERLHKIVKGWPSDAKPENVELVGKCWHCDKLPIPVVNAINEHTASGIRWLMKRATSVQVMENFKGEQTVSWFPNDGDSGDSTDWQETNAPTLIEAISQAITGAKPHD